MKIHFWITLPLLLVGGFFAEGADSPVRRAQHVIVVGVDGSRSDFQSSASPQSIVPSESKQFYRVENSESQ